jgi:hypothetical protein
MATIVSGGGNPVGVVVTRALSNTLSMKAYMLDLFVRVRAGPCFKYLYYDMNSCT